MKNKNFFFTMLLFTVLSFNAIAQSGANDPTFIPGSGATGEGGSLVNTTILQSDGKIIIGGDFTSFNGTTRNRIARLNADGSLDATFNPGTGVNGEGYSAISTTILQSDGKIIIGGEFTSFNGTAINNIARLNPDGTLDTTFYSGTGADDYVKTTAIQSDGKIIIGGWFTSYNGTAINSIARLNTDGTLDTTFNPGTGTDGPVYTTVLQNDGKIIIGGWFTSYNGITRNLIARLNADGSLDSAFDSDLGDAEQRSKIYTIAIQNDGKIIIGGGYYSYNGFPISLITRLNADGSHDQTFNPGTGVNNVIYTTLLQSDGKIIISGLFNETTIVINGIARLNTNGTLDATFNPGMGANGSVNTTVLQSDGKIIIGGGFTSYNGVSRKNIARILNSTTNGICSLQSKATSIYPNPVLNELYIEIEGKNEQTKIEILNSIGQLIFNGNIVEKATVQTSNFAPGVYLIKFGNDKAHEFKKIIKK